MMGEREAKDREVSFTETATWVTDVTDLNRELGRSRFGGWAI